MDANFSGSFHERSKDHSLGHPPISLNTSQWPEEWKTTFFKTYPRLPKIELPFTNKKADFFSLLEKRKSDRNFLPKPISKEDIGTLLKFSVGETTNLGDGRGRRAYPSGGARFPIETYLFVFKGGRDLDSGVYHYDIQKHRLNVLLHKEFSNTEIDDMFTYPWVKNGSLVIVMTATFWRNQMKYGERGYRYILLEAGHIGQNIYLVSETLKLKCCALGGTKDEKMEDLLDIDGVTESVVYGFALGH